MGVNLFKKTACVFLLFFALFGAAAVGHASIFLLEPVEWQLENNESIELGAIAEGETLELVLQRKSGFDFEWDRALVDDSSLSEGWLSKSRATDKTLVVEVSLPRAAEESVQRIPVSLESDASPFSSESFSVSVTVKENLLNASMENLKQRAMVGEETKFKILLNNESIAKQSVLVSSSLPDYWFEPVVLELEPKQTLETELSLVPQSYGLRQFSFKVSSQLNGFQQDFAAELNVLSTLKGKFSSAIFGFPFFTPSLLPNFLINAFLALIS